MTGQIEPAALPTVPGQPVPRSPTTESRVGLVELTAEMCVSGRDLTEPRLSPDGTLVTFVARGTGSAASIVAVSVDGGPERQISTLPPPAPGRGFGGGCHEWLPDGTGVVYAAVDGDVWLQRIAGSVIRVSRTPDRAIAQAPSVSPDGAAVAYMVDQSQIWLTWLVGDRASLRLDDGVDDFCFDPHVWSGATPGGLIVSWQAWSSPDMAWDGSFVRQVEIGDGEVVGRRLVRGTGAVQQPRRCADGPELSVRDDHGWLNVWLDDAPLVDEEFEHASATWGPGQRSYAPSPDGRSVAFTRNERGFGRLCVVDRATGDVRQVARGVHGQLDWRAGRLVALRSGARTPTQVVVYEPDTWHRRTLAVGPVLAWDHIDLPEPELFEVDHDGVTIPARRFAAGKGRAVCWIHGGPTDQWQVEFMPRVAYWWSRGWDIVVPDPRGTTGHGRRHQQALHGGWGRVDVDDTAAVIRHLHAEGWSQPGSTVAVGGSSGGLTVLGLLGDHGDLLAGGVALYPVSDLRDLADRSHRFEAHYTLTLVGDLDETDRYRERSPISYADRIAGPLLIMHGDSDEVVPVEQSRALTSRIRSAGGTVEMHEFEGEGHGFRDAGNKVAEYRMMGEFLARVAPGATGVGG